MSANNFLLIKVDIDTLQGYLRGVPRMLDVLARRGVKASFYFSMGPDNSGKAIFRIFRKGFLQKMLRTKAPATYGLKTMMYGTLVPAPMIVAANPQILAAAAAAGHECGLHAWDHVKWQDKLPKLSQAQIEADLQKAAALFAQVTGAQPKSFAAPGWQLTANALAALDSFNFDYASNTRGHTPCYPVFEGKKFNTLEIPSTLPTMDEIFGANGINDNNVVDYYMSLLKPGLNVHTVHAEMEGGSKIQQFEDLIARAQDRGYKIIPLKEIAQAYKNSGESTIKLGYLPGRAGTLAVQD